MIQQLRQLFKAWYGTRDRNERGGLGQTLVISAAFVLLLGSLGLAAMGVGQSDRIKEYRGAVEKAWDDKRFDDADLFLRKVIRLGDTSPERIYERALIAEEAGDTAVARRRMESIAPLNKVGHGKAHLWLAVYLDNQSIDVRKRLEVMQHLKSAIEDDPRNVDAHAMLGQLYLRDQQPDLAKRHFLVAVVGHPDLAGTTARLSAAAGARDEAITISERAVKHYAELLSIDGNNIASRLKLADLKVFLEQWAEAEEVLRDGMKRSQDRRLPEALAGVYAIRADVYQRQHPHSLTEQHRLLEAAIQLTPRNPGLAKRLTKFVDLHLPLSSGALQAVREHWTEVLDRNPNSEDAHFWLGQTASRMHDTSAAIKHFEPIVDTKPELLLPLARLYLQQNRNDTAHDRAAAAERTFNDLVSAEPDNLQARLRAAEAMSFRGDWQGSIDVLNPELAKAKFGRLARGKLQLGRSQLYTAWGSQLAETDGKTQERIRVLGRAIELAPGNLTAHEQSCVAPGADRS